MRIRKHAKISPLLYATSSLQAAALFQTYVCQLNQSPWDVMTFSPPSSPPPPFQANGSDVRAGNASSDRRDSVSERELSPRRRSEYPNATPKVEAAEEDTAPPPPVENEATILCCKTDGKSRRDTAKDNSLNDKSYSNVAEHAGKKPVKPAVEAPHRTRPKKAPAASSSNPYQFYYYTDFGPWRGKQRGECSTSNGSSLPKNVQVAAAAPAISEDDFDYIEFEDEDEDDEVEVEVEVEVEDEEEEESKDNGKKRARKPIKARSLKSLL